MSETNQPNPRHVEILADLMIKESHQQIEVPEMVMRINHANSMSGVNITLGHTSALTAMRLACEEGEATIKALNIALDDTTKVSLDILRRSIEKEATIQSLRAELEKVKGDRDFFRDELRHFWCDCDTMVTGIEMGSSIVCTNCGKEFPKFKFNP